MTGLRSLGLVFGAAVALPACIIDTGLGETADDGGGVEASGSDGASDSLDPSATSGPPPTATSGSSSMTSGETGDPTATDGPETETGWLTEEQHPFPTLPVDYDPSGAWDRYALSLSPAESGRKPVFLQMNGLGLQLVLDRNQNRAVHRVFQLADIPAPTIGLQLRFGFGR